METNRWIDEFRDLFECESLELQLREDWGADQGSSRSLIRNAISAHTNEDLRDLAQLPKSDRFDISIAHCPGVGGFVLAEKPFSVGLDVEVESRIHQSIVARISAPEEFLAAPSSAHLWAAKEAAFKNLRGPNQPRILSGLFITDWQKLEGKTNDAWRFQVSLSLTAPALEGFGVVFRENSFIISLFCRRSST